MPSFAEATAISSLSSHTYRAHLQDDWVMGSVPHGGYITSIFLRTANRHFTGTHASINQPDTIACHLHFLRRTAVGDALLKVTDLKIGRGTSTVMITLTQRKTGRPGGVGAKDRHDEDQQEDKVVAFFTHSNMIAQTGPTIDTSWSFNPPLSIPSFPSPQNFHSAIHSSSSDSPIIFQPGNADLQLYSFRKALQKSLIFGSRKQLQQRQSAPLQDGYYLDQWISFKSGEKIDTFALGYLADVFPELLHNFSVASDAAAAAAASGTGTPAEKGTRTKAYWFPTVLLNLDIRKRLPAQGVDALHYRVMSRKVVDGRFDIDIVFTDDVGDIVATSTHVSLILDASRNVHGRQQTKPSEDAKPKL